MQDDLEEALRLIKALHLPADILASDDADDEAREQVKCENNEKAKHRNAEAKRIAGGWYFVADAASAIAHQQGWDDVTRLKFRNSMMEAAALGSLAVRDRSTRIPIPAGKLSTLACMVAHKDVNLWLDALGVGYRWEAEPQTEPIKLATTEVASLPHVVDGAPMNWKMQIQAEAANHWRTLRGSGANPTVASILERMAKWCRVNGVLTDGKINPSEGYIRTHVLGGKNWKPPT